jgi:hypothetical protein
MCIVPVSEPMYLDAYGTIFKRKADHYDCNDGVLLSASPAQEAGVSPCPSTCPDLSKSQTLSSLSESGAVLVEVCCLLVLAVDNKVSNTLPPPAGYRQNTQIPFLRLLAMFPNHFPFVDLYLCFLSSADSSRGAVSPSQPGVSDSLYGVHYRLPGQSHL